MGCFLGNSPPHPEAYGESFRMMRLRVWEFARGFRKRSLKSYRPPPYTSLQVHGKNREPKPMLRKYMRDSVEIDGIRLGPATDLAALLRRQLKHGSVWNEVGDPGPEEGLWRVFDAAEGTAVEQRLLRTVVELLTDPDVEIRSGA